jgi:hypothetical protein
LNDGTPERLVPSKDQVPLLGLSNPQSRLNSVVLPAPVRADQCGDRSSRHFEVVDVDGGQATEATLDRIDDEDRIDLGDPRLHLALGQTGRLRASDAPCGGRGVRRALGRAGDLFRGQFI